MQVLVCISHQILVIAAFGLTTLLVLMLAGLQLEITCFKKPFEGSLDKQLSQTSLEMPVPPVVPYKLQELLESISGFCTCRWSRFLATEPLGGWDDCQTAGRKQKMKQQEALLTVQRPILRTALCACCKRRMVSSIFRRRREIRISYLKFKCIIPASVPLWRSP